MGDGGLCVVLIGQTDTLLWSVDISDIVIFLLVSYISVSECHALCRDGTSEISHDPPLHLARKRSWASNTLATTLDSSLAKHKA